MNMKLFGMSDEELIQWLVINAPVTEKDARALFPMMEVYCAQHQSSIYMVTEWVYDKLCCGVRWTTIRRWLARGRELCE